MENGHVTEVVTNGGRIVMLHWWKVQWIENGFVTEEACLMEGDSSC